MRKLRRLEGLIFVAALRGCLGQQRFAVLEVGARRWTSHFEYTSLAPKKTRLWTAKIVLQFQPS